MDTYSRINKFSVTRLLISAALMLAGWGAPALAQSTLPLYANSGIPKAPTNLEIESGNIVSPPSSTTNSPSTTSPISLAQTRSVQTSPMLPQPSVYGDIVGFAINNPSADTIHARYVTFGQVFVDGTVHVGDQLAARNIASNSATALQMDPLATWPDGSVKFAAITIDAPSLNAGSQQSFIIQKAPSQIGSNSAPVNLAAIHFDLTVTLASSASGVVREALDLHNALIRTLASSPDTWLDGPLAAQARVDVPVTKTLHITADITAYKDGTVRADIQFNNDLGSVLAANTPPGPILPPLAYSATITLNGTSVTYQIPAQYQYQDWHSVIASDGNANVNVLHDIRYLEHTGAILPFDLNSGVSAAVFNSFRAIQSTPGFGMPLASNGIAKYMGAPAGRPDIGYTTQVNAAWLMTQDPLPANLSLMQGDTAGAIPWNIRLQNGQWLTPAVNPNIWTDSRSGAWGSVALANGLSISGVYANSFSTWDPDSAHMPDLSYVPYLMTASRWYLDRLDAQASWSLTNLWTPLRDVGGYSDIVLNTISDQQIRAAAWSMREIIEAAWIGKTGSWEQHYFSQVESDNWTWAQSQEHGLAATAGTVSGYWIPSVTHYYDVCSKTTPGCSVSKPSNLPVWEGTPLWQQDMLSGIIIMAAEMGDPQALQIVQWQRNWIVGRFRGIGMNPHDGCAYNLIISKYPPNSASNPTYFTTWDQIENAMTASSISNGSGWRTSDGYYCSLARSVLGGLLTVAPNDLDARAALNWLNSANAPHTSTSDLQNYPSFNIVPLQ